MLEAVVAHFYAGTYQLFSRVLFSSPVAPELKVLVHRAPDWLPPEGVSPADAEPVQVAHFRLVATTAERVAYNLTSGPPNGWRWRATSDGRMWTERVTNPPSPA